MAYKVHLPDPKYPDRPWGLCGVYGTVITTKDPDEVTCKHCLRRMGRRAPCSPRHPCPELNPEHLTLHGECFHVTRSTPGDEVYSRRDVEQAARQAGIAVSSIQLCDRVVPVFAGPRELIP